MNILILCTGNSCRSQMAEGFLHAVDSDINVYSAGTSPSEQVHPKAVKVMAEKGIDISDHRPEHVDKYLEKSFDFVITVCDHAKETCPIFSGEVKQQLHIGFEDPAEATGSEEEIISVFREIRDQIQARFSLFYEEQVKS